MIESPGKFPEIRWRDLYWRLWHGHLHLPPWTVDEMTMGEILLALDDDLTKRRLPEGFTPMDPYAMAQPRPRRTLAERLKRAKEG